MHDATRPFTIFLCGDVMTGRGVDQVLPCPSDARLHEPYVKSALEYVALAENAHGPISKPVDFSYIWGDAVEELERVAASARIINWKLASRQVRITNPRASTIECIPRTPPA